MKPMMKLPITIHKTYPKDALGKRDITLHVSDGTKVTRYTTEQAINKFLKTLKAGESVVRLTSVSASDHLCLTFQRDKVRMLYAYWHDLGLEKGLGPDEIALKVSQADESLFREFVPDEKIAALRAAVSAKDALTKFYTASVLQMKGLARDQGTTDYKSDKVLQERLSDLDQLKEVFRATKMRTDSEGQEHPVFIKWGKKVEDIAKTIPNCVLFAEVAQLKSLGTAASVVAVANGIERFPDVASLWAYFGQSVVDGVAPKRKVGQIANWSAKGRVALYLLGVSILKMTNNPWNAVYRKYKAEELAVHMEKHPGCKAPAAHSDSRARRKMVKEIMKRFYLAAMDQNYLEGHKSKPVVVAVVPSTKTKRPKRKVQFQYHYF